MDLLQTVRKEGSRGGVNFSWDDVKSSQHRENYLGHSLMAPVGRWQKNKDLSWYAKAEDAELTPEQREEKERERKREELRKVKEAEEDAMLRAMGLPVPERGNANLEPLGLSGEKQREVNRAVREALGDDEDEAEYRVECWETRDRSGMSDADLGVEAERGIGGGEMMIREVTSEGGDLGRGRERDHVHAMGTERGGIDIIDMPNVRGHAHDRLIGGGDLEAEATGRTTDTKDEEATTTSSRGQKTECIDPEGRVVAGHGHPTSADGIAMIDECPRISL